MDYEKKYKEAIKGIESLLSDAAIRHLKSVPVEEIENMFPEFNESDDEIIRKALIESITRLSDATVHFYDKVSKKDMLAWLEKQGEKKLTNTVEPRFKINDKVIHKETGKTWTIHWYLADTNSYYVIDEEELINHYSEDVLESAEQKPAEWSDEEVEIIDWLVASFDCLKIPTDTFYQSKVRPFLISLRNKIQPIINEWSEEDEKNFARVDYACLKVYGGDSYSSDWLRKFLGIHKKWKPSEEQITVLAKVSETYCGIDKGVLYSLYNDLKKLREE